MTTKTFAVRIFPTRYEIIVTTQREDPEFVKDLLVQKHLQDGLNWHDAIVEVESTFQDDDERVDINVIRQETS